MTNTLNISDKINPSDKEAIIAVREIADRLNIPFFIVGASARDYILEYCFNATITRKTGDIDIGVKVSNWDNYDNLEKALLDSNKFKKGNRMDRFIYSGTVLIDIIPFGEIAADGRQISWPPEHDIVMTILGFTEALDSSLSLIISQNPTIEIKVTSLAGLAILKLIAWHENQSREREAQDLLTIMTNYDHDDNTERLFGDEIQLNEEENWEIDNSSIRLLGKDMQRIAFDSTKALLSEIFIYVLDEKNNYSIIKDMRRGTSYSDDILFNKVSLLHKGFQDKI